MLNFCFWVHEVFKRKDKEYGTTGKKKHDKIIAKLEQDHKILLYASIDVTRELQFINREWAIGTKLYS